jgi:dTDP-4-amino-4,6-dideoxygalactose transaminase
MINVTRSSMPDFNEYCEEIKEFWDTRWLTNMGVKHTQFESDLKKYLECENVSLYVNGHLALENIIAAFNFPKGSEVITTPFTFASTTHAIVRNELVPVFCDVNDKDYTIDADKIESLITDKTVAILPVHVYGNMCDTDKIGEIAKKYNLKVIYDAAHAFGVKKNGVSSANFGDASMFSFHATKVFNSIEGGAITYSDESLTQILKDLKNFGIHGPEVVNFVGGNAKMNEFQAAMGICNLRHIEEEIEKRKKVTDRYRQNLAGVKGITLCEEQKGVKSNYAYFPVFFDKDEFGVDRDAVHSALKENDIVARKYFYPLTNTFDCYKDKFSALDTPVAYKLSMQVLTLPLYADLEMENVDKICEIIKGLSK